MTSYISTIFIISLTIFTGSATANLTSRITPSRTTCTAPCGIHFEGTGSTDDSNRSINSHNLHGNDIVHYRWDFGSGTETDISSGGRYFNGFNTGHVFETPGNYIVKLMITDASGRRHTGQVAIEIAEFTGEIYCFSNDDDFSGCPSGGIHITTDSWSGITGDNNDILDFVAPLNQLYLKREDTFSYETSTIMGDGPLVIGAFGSGEKPQVQYTGTTGHDPNYAPIYRNGENVSVSDITFDLRSSGNSVSARYGGFAEHLLLLRVDFNNILAFRDLMFLVDSSIQNVDGNPAYSNAEKVTILNNEFGPSLSHGIYGECQHKSIFSGNVFHDVSNSGRTGIRIAANSCSSENVLVTNNTFSNIPAFAIQMRVTTHVTDRFRVKNVLIENNFFENCSGVEVTRDHGFSHITIQNNIFKLDYYGGSGGTGIRAQDQVAYTEEWAKGVESLWVFNNTFYNKVDYHTIIIDQSDIEDFRFFNNIVYGEANLGWNRGVYIKYQNSLNELLLNNNVYYYPNKDENLFYINDISTQYTLLEWQGLGFDTNSRITNPRFTVATPENPDDFMITETSPAKDNGETLPLCYDYNGNKRPRGKGFEIGAFELGNGLYWPMFFPSFYPTVMR